VRHPCIPSDGMIAPWMPLEVGCNVDAYPNKPTTAYLTPTTFLIIICMWRRMCRCRPT
jgi:hypothetical protein